MIKVQTEMFGLIGGYALAGVWLVWIFAGPRSGPVLSDFSSRPTIEPVVSHAIDWQPVAIDRNPFEYREVLAPPAETTYRLKGLVMSHGGRAVIENSEGRSVLLSVGQKKDGIELKAVSADSVRINADGQDVLLPVRAE